MTLGHALRVLHERGRLAAPWLPGMAAVWPNGRGRWRAHQREWGMCAFGEPDGAQLDHWRSTNVYTDALVPDTTDPATVGCLAALGREALRDPRAYARPHHPPWRSEGWDNTWAAEFPRLLVGFVGSTEGDAWARALIQLADELIRGEVLGG